MVLCCLMTYDLHLSVPQIYADQKLSAEVEELRHLQQERPHSCNRTDGLLEQNINKTQHNFSSSSGQSNESSMRMTRKRARLAMETNSSFSPAPVSPQELPITKGTKSNQQKEAPLAYSQVIVWSYF